MHHVESICLQIARVQIVQLFVLRQPLQKIPSLVLKFCRCLFILGKPCSWENLSVLMDWILRIFYLSLFLTILSSLIVAISGSWEKLIGVLFFGTFHSLFTIWSHLILRSCLTLSKYVSVQLLHLFLVPFVRKSSKEMTTDFFFYFRSKLFVSNSRCCVIYWKRLL